jgi:hypothetical protein
MSEAVRFARLLWIACILPVAAQAHIDKVTGQDYRGYERNDGKGSCCDWHDCRPASEPFVEKDGEKIMDRANNKFAFDPDKVVKRPSDDGNWHVCGSGTKLKCIIAPAEARREPGPLDTLFGFLVPDSAEESRALSAMDIDGMLAAAPICTAPKQQ